MHEYVVDTTPCRRLSIQIPDTVCGSVVNLPPPCICHISSMQFPLGIIWDYIGKFSLHKLNCILVIDALDGIWEVFPASN
jgi:hypothetical protein